MEPEQKSTKILDGSNMPKCKISHVQINKMIGSHFEWKIERQLVINVVLFIASIHY